MDNILTTENKKASIKAIVLDLFFSLALFLTPTISHLTSIPFYLFEPMRIIIVLAIVHTNRTNAIFLSVTLPLISFLFSGHPIFPKFIIVLMELSVNVTLYYVLVNILSNRILYNWKQIGFVCSVAMLSSILLSKILYYSVKLLIIDKMVLSAQLFSTPILLQLLVTLALSAYIFIFYRFKG